eukprot:7376096-Prymnesium_polylepis.2
MTYHRTLAGLCPATEYDLTSPGIQIHEFNSTISVGRDLNSTAFRIPEYNGFIPAPTTGPCSHSGHSFAHQVCAFPSHSCVTPRETIWFGLSTSRQSIIHETADILQSS